MKKILIFVFLCTSLLSARSGTLIQSPQPSGDPTALMSFIANAGSLQVDPNTKQLTHVTAAQFYSANSPVVYISGGTGTLTLSGYSLGLTPAQIPPLDASKIIGGTIPVTRLPVGKVGGTIAAGDDYRLPNDGPLEGAGIQAYGNSYLAINSTQATRRYIERLADRLDANYLLNHGVGGWLAADCCAFAYGNFSATTAYGTVPGTWVSSPNNRGLVVLEVLRNDAGHDSADPTKSRLGFTNSLDALIRLIRSSARLGNSDTSFVYAGTWSVASDVHSTGGGFHYTYNPGDHCTITTPVGSDFTLVVKGIDAAAAGGNGSAFTVSVDGGTAITGTTQNQMRYPGNGAAAGNCQLAIPLSGLSNAVHTVVLTHAGNPGDALFLDSLLVTSATPPTILIPKAAYLGATGYANYGGNASTATDDIYNALLDTEVARFPSDNSVLTWNPNMNGWNPATMLWYDGVHPNDRGMAFYANGLIALLNTLNYRDGQNSIGANTIGAFEDTINRANWFALRLSGETVGLRVGTVNDTAPFIINSWSDPRFFTVGATSPNGGGLGISHSAIYGTILNAVQPGVTYEPISCAASKFYFLPSGSSTGGMTIFSGVNIGSGGSGTGADPGTGNFSVQANIDMGDHMTILGQRAFAPPNPSQGVTLWVDGSDKLHALHSNGTDHVLSGP